MRWPAPLRPWNGLATGLVVGSAAALGVFVAGAAPTAERNGEVLAAALDGAVTTVRGQVAAKPGERAQRTATALEHALDAWRNGRRHLALQRFAPLLAELETASYLRGLDAPAADPEAFLTAEWERQGARATAQLARTGDPGTLAAIRPAAVRAIGEAALLQARGYHAASLPYGRATEPQQGLYYLGSALGHQAVLELSLRLDEPVQGAAPRLRSIAPEIAALESDVLTLYRPPAAIERHSDFIAASAMLKEARELDEAGLHHGALLRYLQAALQLAPLRGSVPAAATASLRSTVTGQAERLADERFDHSIGRIFVEAAAGDLDTTSATGGQPAVAAAIAAEVLPRYFAALEPAASRETRPAPPPIATQVVVTLVRWPYT